jgi:F-type H+-transporting ATPase subunit a
MPYQVALASEQVEHAAAPAAAVHAGQGEHAATTSAESHAAVAYELPHEVPNIVSLMEASGFRPVVKLLEATAPKGAEAGHEAGRPEPIASFLVNPFFSILYVILIVWIVRKGLRNASVRSPGKLQNAVEALLGGLRDFYLGIMGEQGRPFVPYLATLFLFIWANNVAVLVPGLKSPDSSFQTTIALAIATFLYARYHNIKRLGWGGYFYHLIGSPEGAIMWCMAPLFLVLELIGEVIKPLSLGLRLFGNILGEDKLMAVFLGLGMMIVAVTFKTPTPWIGVPLHLPFFFLVILLSTIQAVVFTTLAAIYILLMLPHEHEHGNEKGGEEPSHAG